MRKVLLALAVTLPLVAWSASSNNWPMEEFKGDLENLPSLQNGFQLYTNYCLGCHSLQFQRYERTANDLGIPHDIAMENLVFTGQKIGALMTNAMPRSESKAWFGAAPPDLTMVTRVRNPEWVYNYLKTFYADPGRPLGANNKVYPNVGMPNVLLDLQGIQREACVDGRCDQLVVDPGSGRLTPAEFDAAIYDLTNFLYYTGEPSRLQRQRTGVYVLLFLIILGCFTYLLNREYWKDIDGH